MQEETGTSLTIDPPAVRRDARPIALVLGVAAVAFAADLATKIWALQALQPGEPRDLVGSWLRLNLVRNPGAAFSLGDGATLALTLVALGIVGAVLWQLRTLTSRPWAVGLGLVLGGAVGNLVDRFFRAPGPLRGHVVDFLDYGGFFVGNVADIWIVGAAAFMVLLTLRGIPMADPTEPAVDDD